MLLKVLISAVVYLVSVSCFGQGLPDVSERKRLHVKYINHPNTVFELQHIPVCSNYGCKTITNISITESQWKNILSYFSNTTNSAIAEREQLRKAIGQIELIAGEQTNTQYDLGGTFKIYANIKSAKSEQMDCIDESTNTLLYLRLLNQNKKLKFHEILGLRSRGGLRAGYPHTAVLLKDNTSGQKFIIDSWFHGNGEPAEVVLYANWKRGWKPK
ncbi:MAG: hypothetical protein AAF304_03760 [Pseudomonadota bacterium]